jgi:periplasmic divalent cation tolerance protein
MATYFGFCFRVTPIILSMIVVFTTVADADAAEELAEKIIDARHAACVQILPPMTSVYVWEGKLQKQREHLLLIKTLPEKWEQLRDLITAKHSYDVPEIVAVDVEMVSEPYIQWLQAIVV